MILDIFFILLLFLNLFFLSIIVYNFFTAPTVQNVQSSSVSSNKLSILIPARNEENNIAGCLDSVLNQSHQNFEVIVLDDDSSDNTYNVVEEYTKQDPRIKIAKGKSLPIGWLGKNWACFQLAKLASNDLFLFIDADVRLNKHAVSSALNIVNDKSLNMLSVFPSQQINGIGAQLVVPLMNWLLLTFLPLVQVYKSSRPSFVAANGQFILIDRTTYETTGGHSSVRDQVVEDMELARRIKKRGLKMMTALGGDSIYCRMYNSFSDSVNGFSKNFFKGFNINPILFLLLIIFITLVFLVPLFLLILNVNFLLIVIIVLIGRAIISLISKQNIFINTVLHFIQMGIIVYVGIKSVYGALVGTHVWKGRKI